MKKIYSYIILSSIIILPMSAHASFGDWVRSQFQNINTGLDSAGNQIATIIWPWGGNLENGVVPLDWVADDDNFRDSDGGVSIPGGSIAFVDGNALAGNTLPGN